jgi:hypothetical protein
MVMRRQQLTQSLRRGPTGPGDFLQSLGQQIIVLHELLVLRLRCLDLWVRSTDSAQRTPTPLFSRMTL